MSVIKKHINQKLNFDNKTGKIKYWVEILQDQIEIKLYSTETIDDIPTEVVILWDIIKLQSLQSKPGFVDQTWWTRIPEINLPLVLDDDGAAFSQELHESSIVDMLGETVVIKPASIRNRASPTVDALYTFFMPSTDNFNSCVFRISVNPDYTPGFEVVGPSAGDFVDQTVTLNEVIAPITLSSTQTNVSADSSITVTVATAAYIKEVYLEQVCGILNKARVKLTNGQGSFKIMTDGLQVGEEIRVKAGHKKYTGIASFSKQIS